VAYGTQWREEKFIQAVGGKTCRKSLRGRSTRRWEIIGKIVLKETEFRAVDCIHGAYSRIQRTSD